jgi:hypothetical protein
VLGWLSCFDQFNPCSELGERSVEN